VLSPSLHPVQLKYTVPILLCGVQVRFDFVAEAQGSASVVCIVREEGGSQLDGLESTLQVLGAWLCVCVVVWLWSWGMSCVGMGGST
jgi:hypothetical protein